jgi:hypothetical protein
VDWVQLGQDSVSLSRLVKLLNFKFHKSQEFLDQLRTYQTLKTNTSTRNKFQKGCRTIFFRGKNVKTYVSESRTTPMPRSVAIMFPDAVADSGY